MERPDFGSEVRRAQVAAAQRGASGANYSRRWVYCTGCGRRFRRTMSRSERLRHAVGPCGCGNRLRPESLRWKYGTTGELPVPRELRTRRAGNHFEQAAELLKAAEEELGALVALAGSEVRPRSTNGKP